MAQNSFSSYLRISHIFEFTKNAFGFVYILEFITLSEAILLDFVQHPYLMQRHNCIWQQLKIRPSPCCILHVMHYTKVVSQITERVS